jgi:hypothetical protein
LVVICEMDKGSLALTFHVMRAANDALTGGVDHLVVAGIFASGGSCRSSCERGGGAELKSSESE